MTCTYAAMKRGDFVKLALQFDSIVMEESAQVLDIETLIPMRLQRDLDGLSRLKRCVLIGDHNQLPPVVKNMTLRQASNLEQSLFTRLIRLGTPFIELNAQGRCRSSIADLYNWKYEKLGNLPSIESPGSEFELGNPGFKFDYQLINIEDYNGQGENAPAPHFIQNLGEAEYAVTLYQHMRLLGYPASKITILTTYNGQKALINDVIERRCAYYPLFGRPAKVETVDRFQGQQNDYVIVSLVRTKAVGHIRDVRRLIVAMSRARLGLFVLGRARLFSSCLELKPTFSKLLERPTELHIIPDETYPTKRKHGSECKSKSVSMEELTKTVVEKVQGWEQQQQNQMQH
jgi:intron-binding protein aquarius